MKKLLLFVLMAITAISFNACSKDGIDDSPIIEFKDPNFLEEILAGYNSNWIDINRDGQISEKEASLATTLTIGKIGANIRGMDEIDYFTALTVLYCTYCNLPSLDISKNTALTQLGCHGNKLTALDVSNNRALKELDCSYNQISSLDLSQNTALERLECDKNKLTVLDISKCKNLKFLACGDNQLKSLVVYKYYPNDLELCLNYITRNYGDIITYME